MSVKEEDSNVSVESSTGQAEAVNDTTAVEKESENIVTQTVGLNYDIELTSGGYNPEEKISLTSKEIET